MATLGDTPQDKQKTVDVVNVVRHGDSLVIPENMSLERVDKVIHQKIEFDNTVVAISAIIPGFVPDAAYAFFQAMSRTYGWVNQVPTPGFFGPEPPATITIEIGRGKSVQVPFGRFELPYMDGYLESGVVEDPKKRGVGVFTIGGQIKRQYEPKVNELVELAKRIVREESIYRGQAFRLRLKDDRGRPMPFPTPSFLDLKPEIEKELVFSENTLFDVQVNLFTPIEQTEACRKHHIPLKRGVLLAGAYGVGKTMAAHATAVKCVRNGWTYIVAERADELAEVLRLAQELGGPVVVFCEDIDRIMSGERSIDSDMILNIIDGVESKAAELMIVLTTNDIDNIQPALLRPGRLDAVIYVELPDAGAAEKLARQYGRNLIASTEDLSGASAHLAGNIPAVIREAVERSKMAAIFVNARDGGNPVDDKLLVTNEALLRSAKGMEFQLQKLMPKPEDKRSETVKAAEMIANAHIAATSQLVEAGAGQPFVPPFAMFGPAVEKLVKGWDEVVSSGYDNDEVNAMDEIVEEARKEQ